MKFGKLLKRLAIAIIVIGLTTVIILNLPTFGGKIEGKRLQQVENSLQFKDGAFRNPEPQAERSGSMAMLKEQFWGDQIRTPPIAIPVVKPDLAFLDKAPAPGLRAIWFGHSTVVVEIDGLRVLTDPVLSEYASPFQFFGPQRFHEPPIALNDLKNVDAVVISHDHYDHLDMATAQYLSDQGAQFFVPLGIGTHLEKWGIPATQITELDWWETAKLNDVEIAATPNRHYSGRGLTDYKATLWSSWSIIGPQHRVFYSGDTGYSKGFKQIGNKYGPFDLTIIKVGAYGPGQAWKDVHMEPEQAVQVHLDVQGRQMLPVHWATFNMAFHDWDEPIERTIKAAKAHQVMLATPRIGQIFDRKWTKNSDPWWIPAE